MQSLETQVREALIQKRADESYKLMKTPKYQVIMRDMAETMMTSLFGALGEEFGDEDLSSEVMLEISGEINKLCSNPEQLRQVAYQGARNEYMTSDQIKSLFKETCRKLNKDGDFGNEANEKMNSYFDHQNRIVSGLVEIAERNGIEKALIDEAEHKVIRGIFPTADEYIAHALGGIQEVKEYFANVQKAMMMDGEMGQLIGAIYSGMQKAIEEMKNLNEQVQRDKIHKKAAEIYGE